MAEQPKRAAYDAAKARHAAWTPAQHRSPTPDMLADVALIRAYEQHPDHPDNQPAGTDG